MAATPGRQEVLHATLPGASRRSRARSWGQELTGQRGPVVPQGVLGGVRGCRGALVALKPDTQ